MNLKLRTLAAAALVLAVALGVMTIGSTASSPGSDSVAVPTTPGSPPTVIRWTGTVPPASVHANDCNSPSTVASDTHLVTLNVPSTGYKTFDAEFTFTITWTPVATTPTVNASDLVLTVNAPKGGDEGDTETSEVGSSDGGEPKEVVVAHNLRAGQYEVLACGFSNALGQDYQGELKIEALPKAASTGVASADAQGLAFGAATTADPQRDEAEPLIEIDRDGVIYTCGPSGFSNGVDYAQVSTDDGDQFHILGTPPRGQHGAGGGGDCGLATGVTRNGAGKYQYAYSGLGALTGYTTATSADNGHSIASSGLDSTGVVTNNGAASDRQWLTFTDDHTVLMTWNQQAPRNTVVLRSTDGGLNYDFLHGSIVAPNPEFPGPIRYSAATDVTYLPWTKGEEVNLAVSQDRGTTWTNCKVATGDVVKGGTSGFAVADHDSAGNIYVVWSDSSSYHTWLSVLTADKVAGCNQSIAAVRATASGQPTVDPGWSTPVQVDRDEVKTTVFPWVAAGGAPGRVAVAFYGTPSDGDPNSGSFKGAWYVYVSQSLNALDAGRTFGQVRATTHPFHYDSICLNGLGCDLSVPKGDRTLADFFAISYNAKSGRLSIVFDRDNKKPDEELGHVATPMVVTQIAGASNGGGVVSVTGRDPVRASTTDSAGDAQSSYSAMAPGAAPPAPQTKNEPAADFTSVSVGPDTATGGFTVTMKLADLSSTALTSALSGTGGQSLVWLWRFANGHQDSAVQANWNPATGFGFGFNDYTTGPMPCSSTGNAVTQSQEKCVVYPGDKPVVGSVDQASGTIKLTVPGSYLRALSGLDEFERPLEAAATVGSRFYDGSAFSFANTVSATQAAQSFLYTLDSTPPFDFLLPAAPAASSGGGGGSPGGGGGSSGGGGGGGGGGGSAPAPGGTLTPPEPTAPPVPEVKGAKKTVVHSVTGRGTVRASIGRSAVARFALDNRHVTYVDLKSHLTFRSTKINSIRFGKHSATLRGTGKLNGKRIAFHVVAVDGKPDTIHVWLGSRLRHGVLLRGTVVVR